MSNVETMQNKAECGFHIDKVGLSYGSLKIGKPH